MIDIGHRVPSVTVSRWTKEGPEQFRSDEVLGEGKVVLFGVPGAFTRNCSDFHLPGFVRRADEIRVQGVDRIVCVGVNDAYVMGAWALAEDPEEKITFIADGNGDLARAMDVEVDLRDLGLGMRNARYVAVLVDGLVQHVNLEDGPGVNTTSADAVLTRL